MNPTCCHASHPYHQRDWRSWRCPLCDHLPLELDYRARDAAADCPRLHSDDQLGCPQCGFTTFGNVLSLLQAVQTTHEPCPTCTGQCVRPDGSGKLRPCETCKGRGCVRKRKPHGKHRKKDETTAIAC